MLDEQRNKRGGSPVPYWSVDSLETAREMLLGAGCIHHRGPLDVGDGRKIAQVVDPFGNIIGIDGY
ncbi:VOC family protein [Streptomyces decoyicus]|uniref:VOC family protein n=1 Tax=Streptomyces decoyicus TaxID=249567 RepID=UPI00362CBBE6